MNKNVKRIIAMALVIGTISAVAPVTVTNVNLLATKAYASTNDTTTLDSLKLETTSGNAIKLYSDSDYASGNKVDSSDVTEGDTYYAKTSATTINISISGPSSKYVKVFKGTSSSAKGKSISSDISLSTGSTTTLTVRVYDSTPDSSITYDDDSYVSEYTIKVKCTASDSSSSDSSDNSDNYDDIYLSKLSINGESISLSKSKTTYTYNVASDVDEVPIKATPEDTSYTVKIDDTEVDDSDNYKRTVSLDKGTNKIEVEIQNEDDDTDRVYTLNITRGSTSTSGNTGTSTPNNATDISTVKASQWVQVNGIWQYNDAMGNAVKNSWFFDRNYSKNYFLQADGSMATGWLSNNGKWYYLGTDGGMKTGWIIDGGKYYYLYADGSMAFNTTISGYKLGASGAWIG